MHCGFCNKNLTSEQSNSSSVFFLFGNVVDTAPAGDHCVSPEFEPETPDHRPTVAYAGELFDALNCKELLRNNELSNAFESTQK